MMDCEKVYIWEKTALGFATLMACLCNLPVKELLLLEMGHFLILTLVKPWF